jgi:hypothetical protein
MSKTILFDLDHNKKKLEYYQALKARSGSEKSKILNKWIEIYSERVQKLDRQASRLGLKTQLKAAEKAAAASA